MFVLILCWFYEQKTKGHQKYNNNGHLFCLHTNPLLGGLPHPHLIDSNGLFSLKKKKRLLIEYVYHSNY